jgi:hypothetical protein
MDTYSQVAGAMVFVLVAVLFILLFTLNKPENELLQRTVAQVKQTVIEHLPDIKFKLDSKILYKLNFALYSSIMLFVLSVLTLIFLIRAS